MIRGEQLTLPMVEDVSGIEAEPGVSVSLEDRARALGNLVAMYDTLTPALAKAEGMVKALENPTYRKEMAERYKNPDKVAAAALGRVTRILRAEEVRQAKVLVNASGFAAHGIEDGDIETLILQTTIEARQAFGTRVESERRGAILKSLYTPREY